MRTPVLATKLYAPPRRPRLVARPRLVEHLDTTLDPANRLTLVSAPAGFGKTTLLGDWLAHLESRATEVGVGWLSLDEDDNDLARFLAHLTAALRAAGLDVQPAPLDRHPGTPSLALTDVVNDVVSAAGALPATHRVLVLDDLHAVNAPDVHEALSFLLEHLPGSLCLLMATRADPPLPLARLRGRGELTEVRAADLRFTPGEAAEFLNDVMGLDLSTNHAAALEGRTEGWVAGLQLAALSLRGMDDHDDVAGFIEAFTGSNRFVIDYLADEVLARQPDRLRDFLLRTSILDRLTGSLCDAVTTGEAGDAVLEELERGNLFVVPLDDRRAWYRYHHLFADVLAARLLAEHPGEVRELHGRASAWYADHDLPVRAVRHALAAEDFGRAAHLMEEALPGMRRARQDSLLLTWMESLPDPVVRRSPVLTIVSAWSRLMAGDLEAMERRLDDAEAALAAGARDPDLAREWADTEDLRTAPATISVYRASLAQARGDVAGTVRHARRALDLAGPDDHVVRGGGGGFLGLAAWAQGDVAEAVDVFGGAVRSLHAAGNLVDELDATIPLADMWVAAGRPGRARELYDRGLQRIADDGEPPPRAAADLHVGLSELDRELDDLAGAEAHLATAQVLARRTSITENRHRWYVAMADLRAASGDHRDADQLLDEAERLYRHGFYPDVRPIPARRARLRLAAGDLEAAARWAHDRGVGVDDDPAYLREYEHLTLVRLLLAEHRTDHRTGASGGADPVRAALAVLDRLHRAAAGSGRAGSVLEIAVLQALAHHAVDDMERAGAVLGRALAEAPEPEGHVRLYLDEGPPMHDLLRRAVAEHGVTLPGRLGQRLDRVGGHGPVQSLPDPLSQRELEVLRLLDSDLSGPEIARQLYVSLNTLRTHTKRIFTKLDVTNRAAAVRRARALGLL